MVSQPILFIVELPVVRPTNNVEDKKDNICERINYYIIIYVNLEMVRHYANSRRYEIIWRKWYWLMRGIFKDNDEEESGMEESVNQYVNFNGHLVS